MNPTTQTEGNFFDEASKKIFDDSEALKTFFHLDSLLIDFITYNN